MPTYEYRCKRCGTFEIMQPISEDPLFSCPHCGEKVSRLISSNVNFILKGSGFYTTEYRSEEFRNKLKEEDKVEAKSDKEKRDKNSSEENAAN